MPKDNSNKLSLHNVSFSAGNKKIVNKTNLDIKKGSFTAIIGPNGSGKSTLLKLIYGLYKSPSGEILIDGKNVSEIKSRLIAQKMAVLTQENPVDFPYTAMEIVLMGRSCHHELFNGESPQDRQIALESLEITGMAGRKNQEYSLLSGGEKQRVLLARALAQKTDFLVLDEPTNHLDIGHQLLLMELLSNLGITILAVIHDINLAYKYASDIHIMNEGSIIKSGPPKKVINESVLAKIFNVETQITPSGINYIGHCNNLL